jgi:hypothetical protein
MDLSIGLKYYSGCHDAKDDDVDGSRDIGHVLYSNKHIRIQSIKIMNETLTGSDQGSFIVLSLRGPFTIKFSNESAMGESAHGECVR